MSDKEQSYWFQMGKSAGLIYASDRMMQAAILAFLGNQDIDSIMLRGHARHLSAQAEEAKPITTHSKTETEG